MTRDSLRFGGLGRRADTRTGSIATVVDSPGARLYRLWVAMYNEPEFTVRCAGQAARGHNLRRSGTIIPIGSVNCFTPDAGVPAYAAAKGGFLLTKSLARELEPHAIRVNGVAPSGTDTPRMRKAIAELGLSREQLVQRTPLERRGESEESAAVVAFLASVEASYVSRQMLAAGGGFLCT